MRARSRPPPVASLTGAAASQSQLRRNLKRFLIGNKLNLIGLIIVVVFFLLAIFGQALAPYDPYAQDITGSKLLAPSHFSSDGHRRAWARSSQPGHDRHPHQPSGRGRRALVCRGLRDAGRLGRRLLRRHRRRDPDALHRHVSGLSRPDPGDRDRRVTRPRASLDDGRAGDGLLALVRPSRTRANSVHPGARLSSRPRKALGCPDRACSPGTSCPTPSRSSSSSSRSTSVTRFWRPARSRSSALARNPPHRNGAR